MGDYAYTKVNGKLRPLLTKIREVGVPPKATGTWLKQVGFTSSNDASLLRVLSQIGFIGDDKIPTNHWKDYRGSSHATTLAAAIVSGYNELFQMYPNAYDRSEDELRDFFSTHTESGAQVVSAMIATFRTLTSQAEFTKPVKPIAASQTKESKAVERKINVSTAKVDSNGQPVNVTINVQLTLPETKDDEVYDKFFAALKKHLMS
jgi:hypothetical protein